LSDIDGQAGRLSYRGYDIHQLAGAATFEEIAYLLQRGSPPDAVELDSFWAEIAAGRTLGKLVAANLAEVSASQEPMEAMRTLVSLASADDPDKDSNAPDANSRKAARLTAQQPILVAAYDAARSGRDRGQFPAPDARGGTLRPRGGDSRYMPGPARRSHHERLHIRRTRLRRHPVGHVFRCRRRARHPQGAPAWRRERAGHARAGGDQGGRARRPGGCRRAGGPRASRARREDHGLRAPRLQDRGPARHPPAPVLRG